MKKFFNSESGSILILTAAFLAIAIGILVLVILLNRSHGSYSNNQSAIDNDSLSTVDWVFRLKKEKIGQAGYDNQKWMEYRPSDAEIKTYAMTMFDSAMQNNGQDYRIGNFDVNFSNDIPN